MNILLFFFLFFLFLSSISFISINTPIKKQREYVLYIYFLFYALALFVDRTDFYDYEIYVDMFRYYNDYNIEFTYKIISFFISQFSSNPLGIIVVYCTLSLFVFAYVIAKYSIYPLWAILVYYSNFYFQHELIQIRGGVASAFILLGILKLAEKNKAKFAIYILLASCFHVSSLIILSLLFVSVTKPRRRVYALLIPASYFLFFMGCDPFVLAKNIGLIAEKVNGYLFLKEQGLEALQLGNVWSLFLLVKILIAYLFLFNWNIIQSKDRYAIILLKVYIISLAVQILFSSTMVISYRLSDVFRIVEILVIPFFFYICKPTIVAAAIVFIYNLVIIRFSTLPFFLP